MNMFPVEIAFWITLFLLLHCYVIFPVTLPFLSEIFKRKQVPASNEPFLPKVSILVSAYNEAEIIEKKLKNFLELDYPKDLLEILVGDDGSVDATAEIVSRYADQGIILIKAHKNAGKAAMLNRLQKEAHGEILVFCDANTMFFPNVIRKLVEPFRDRKIGCTCGHLILSDSSDSLLGQGESSYWDLESEIKKFEGILDLLIGGNGALYAIRNDLFTSLPTKKSIMDDFFITVKILQKGFFCTFVSSAIGTETTSKEGVGEYRRKIRIGRANYNYLFSYLPLLNPLRPLLAYLFFSHKLLRWFTPHLCILLIVFNAILLATGKPIFFVSFILSLLVIFLSVSKLSRSAYYFLSMNTAMFKGFFLSFKRERSGGWAREARGDDRGPSSMKVLPWLTAAILGLSGAFSTAEAGFTADFTIGSLNPTETIKDCNLDLVGHWWFPADEMVFGGVGVGYETIDGIDLVPVIGSLWVRLPIGRQVLPVVTADFGYAFGEDAQMLWKVGGGFDIKNGKNSSILLLGGYQELRKYGNFIYLRAGLLLEL